MLVWWIAESVLCCGSDDAWRSSLRTLVVQVRSCDVQERLASRQSTYTLVEELSLMSRWLRPDLSTSSSGLVCIACSFEDHLVIGRDVWVADPKTITCQHLPVPHPLKDGRPAQLTVGVGSHLQIDVGYDLPIIRHLIHVAGLLVCQVSNELAIVYAD